LLELISKSIKITLPSNTVKQ